GNYEVQNYARYVHGFGAKNAAGEALHWDRADKDTWRVATRRADHVLVDFDYSPDTIDLSVARSAEDFGQFLGTNLFMLEEGQLAIRCVHRLFQCHPRAHRIRWRPRAQRFAVRHHARASVRGSRVGQSGRLHVSAAVP